MIQTIGVIYLEEQRTGWAGRIIMAVIGLVIVACIGVAWWLYITGIQPGEVEKEIEGIIRSSVVIEQSANSIQIGAKLLDMATDEPVDEPEEQFDQNLLRKIDFEELQAINTDAQRWIFIPDTNIDYYVMQERNVGEYYYLYNNIYRASNWWGSILTAAVPDNQDDAHLIVFGHHMDGANDVAFSNLPQFVNKSYGEAHPYVYMYYPDHSERWKVWSSCQLWQSDMVYEIPYTLGSSSYQELIDHIDASGYYTLAGKPSNRTRTLFLSTCNGYGERFVLGCVPDIAYYYPEENKAESGTPEASPSPEGQAAG